MLHEHRQTEVCRTFQSKFPKDAKQKLRPDCALPFAIRPQATIVKRRSNLNLCKSFQISSKGNRGRIALSPSQPGLNPRSSKKDGRTRTRLLNIDRSGYVICTCTVRKHPSRSRLR